MLEIIKKHPGYFIAAILVHVIFLVIFTVRFHFQSQQRAASTQPQTVKVTTVDEKLVQKELKSFKASDERERQRSEQLRRQREAEEKKLAAARAKRLQEQKLEQQRQAEAKRKALALKRQAEEARRQRAQNEKALKQQLAAEAKRMQAEKQAAEKRKQAELQAAAERRAAQKAQQTEIDKYMNLIENRIYQNWVKPPGIAKGLKCVLEVQLIPGGEVIDVQVSKSSGNQEYDQSVVAAVRRASPLPVPSSDSGLFDDFRNLTLPVQSDKKI